MTVVRREDFAPRERDEPDFIFLFVYLNKFLNELEYVFLRVLMKN